MLTNFNKAVLYIGFTGNLFERVSQHKSGQVEGFTKKYKVTNLVYYEEFDDINNAKARETFYEKMEAGMERRVDQ